MKSVSTLLFIAAICLSVNAWGESPVQEPVQRSFVLQNCQTENPELPCKSVTLFITEMGKIVVAETNLDHGDEMIRYDVTVTNVYDLFVYRMVLRSPGETPHLMYYFVFNQTVLEPITGDTFVIQK